MAVWADTPFPLNPTPVYTKANVKPGVLYVADEMASAHNGIIRGLNAIYNQAPYVKSSKDQADFLQYMTLWIHWVHDHHQGEEEFVFPAIADLTGQKDIMAQNVEQHHEFEPSFDKFEEYVKACSEKGEFNSVALITYIDEFAPPLTKHLKAEIGTLLGLNEYDDVKLKKILLQWEERIKNAEGATFNEFPMVCGCHDNTYEAGRNWPPVPGFVKYLVHYVFQRKFAGAWRFNPSDAWGKPRPLPFGPPEST